MRGFTAPDVQLYFPAAAAAMLLVAVVAVAVARQAKDYSSKFPTITISAKT